MKLIRFGDEGREEPGMLLPDGRRLDASGEFNDYDEGFFASGGLEALAEWVADGCPAAAWRILRARGSVRRSTGRRKSSASARTTSIMPRNSARASRPSRRFSSRRRRAWSGPHDDVMIPRGARKLDYEVELALVIGRTATGIDEQEALDHVAGYAVFCDFSERAFQKEMGGQWTKGKSADSFAPMGPWLTTADEVADPQKLRLWCKVNGEMRQNSWTGDMMFSVRQLVSYISRFMTLLPGDVVATGTPSGVAMGMSPPRYLQAGDFVECGVEGLGELAQRVVAFRQAMKKGFSRTWRAMLSWPKPPGGSRYSACHFCDTLHEFSPVDEGMAARCARCGGAALSEPAGLAGARLGVLAGGAVADGAGALVSLSDDGCGRACAAISP